MVLLTPYGIEKGVNCRGIEPDEESYRVCSLSL